MAAMGMVAWLALRGSLPPTPAPVSAASPGASVPSPIAVRPLVPPPPRRTATAPPPSTSGDVEVCGLGSIAMPVPAREAGAAVIAALVAPLGLDVEAAWVAWLDASALEHDRALGHALAVPDPLRLQALVELAVHTRDARVYRLALARCAREADDAEACERLSAEQWARLDADNAAPWLRIARQAAQRGDTTALADALYRAAHARRLDVDADGAARLLQRAELAALPPLRQLALSVQLSAQWAALPWPDLLLAHEHCVDAALDLERQPLCSALARLYLDRADSAAVFALDVQIAQAAGWSAEALQRLAQQRDALRWAEQQLDESATAAAYGCDAWDARRRWQAERAGSGELGALRRVLADSRRSDAELAAQWRAGQPR
jgi:hypothetical protein